MVYNRWGRVGMKGQDKIFGPYNLQDTAINEFEQKFFAKTKNHWSNRRQFTSYPKCYTWLEMDYSANQKEESVVSSFITKILNSFVFRKTEFSKCYFVMKLSFGKWLCSSFQRKEQATDNHNYMKAIVLNLFHLMQ